MHVKISGFKIHLNLELTFEDGKMTLLKGESGVGKSTILQAIFWAFYGNMRSIYNNAKVTKNLSVTIILPNMVIFRKKNPELLRLTLNIPKPRNIVCPKDNLNIQKPRNIDCPKYNLNIDNKSKSSQNEDNENQSYQVYEDDIAQAMIDNYYGNREL